MEASAAPPESPIVESIPTGDSFTSEPSPSSEVDLDSLSADALIDHFASGKSNTEEAPAETEAPPAEPVEAKPVEEKAEAKPEEPIAEPEEPTFKEPEPENLKKAFKSLSKFHPEVAKELRDSFYAAKAFREQFTFPEVKELKQTFATVQDAKEARVAQADLLAMNQGLHDDPVGLLKHIQRNDPNGFVNLAVNLPNALYEMSPDAYRSGVSGPAVARYHESFAAYAEKTGDEDLKTAIEIIKDREAARLGGRVPSKPVQQAQVDPATQRELESYRQREAQANQAALGMFEQSVNQDFESSIGSEVDKAVERSGATLTQEAKQEIREFVTEQVKDRLLADQILQRKVNFAMRSAGGNLTADHKQRITNELVANGRRFVAADTAARITHLSKLLGLAQNARPPQVAPRREPGGSAVTAQAKGPLTREQRDSMSADEIINHFRR